MASLCLRARPVNQKTGIPFTGSLRAWTVSEDASFSTNYLLDLGILSIPVADSDSLRLPHDTNGPTIEPWGHASAIPVETVGLERLDGIVPSQRFVPIDVVLPGCRG